jgi:hypothetical protein
LAEAKKIPGWLIPTFAFLPWLVYVFASGSNHWGVATVGGLVACVPYLAILARRSTIKLMDWTTVAFFVAASAFAIEHSEVLAKYQVMIIWSFFAVAGWISMVVSRPFTVAYAREEQPPEVWDLPVFHRLNHLLTLFWCGLFTVNVGMGAIAVMVGGNFGRLVPGFLIPTALLIYGLVFSRRFPPRYVQRVNAAAAESPSMA